MIICLYPNPQSWALSRRVVLECVPVIHRYDTSVPNSRLPKSFL